ncbi:response regulator transcription factor [Hyphococcus sp.]|jgi:two-component system response regulator FixJ|uniref:response regulator transcription factor n=1 Tax=Hyphococcus sp. TaxID=2038636 RepID=UPI003D0B88BE
MTTKGKVFLVDDDPAVQRGVSALLKAADYDVTVFPSGDAFLEKISGLDLGGAALLVDVRMPGIQGLELQEKLLADGVALPVVVMTAHGDIPMAVRAMQNGAASFLEKPFTAEEVTDALDRALAGGGASASVPAALTARFETLTPREREVMAEIVKGGANKEIARILDVSPRTVEVHRQKVMSKMEAGSVAELVRMGLTLGLIA